MRFIIDPALASHDATQPKNDTNRPRTYRSTPQTRRRNDLPDTTTITISHATDAQLLTNKILDADPNRSTHYLPPKLKGRILR